MAEAVIIGKRSLCDRDQVGAVVVDRSNRIVDSGYNGPPAGWVRPWPSQSRPAETCKAWCPRAKATVLPQVLDPAYEDCPSLHAEANALMFSDRRLREGGTIYVSSGTCGGCAKLVANSGLARAVYVDDSATLNRHHRDSFRWYDFLRDCGLEVTLC